MQAYVLIECLPGRAATVLKTVKKIKGVDCAEAVTGPYDIIAYVDYKDQDALGDIVVRKIQSHKGVVKTVTCLVVGLR